MNSQANFNSLHGASLSRFGNTIPMYFGEFRAWYKNLLSAVAKTPAKVGLDKLNILNKLDNIEKIIYTTGSPYASNKTYTTYSQIAGKSGAESVFKPYKNDVIAFFSQIDSVLNTFENFAKANISDFAGKIDVFENRKALLPILISKSEPYSETYNKLIEEQKTYKAIESIFQAPNVPIEMYAYVMTKTNETLNPMIVKIESTQNIDIVKDTTTNEIVSVSKNVTDSTTNQAVSSSNISTTNALDQATGNVIEIASNKITNAPLIKTATIQHNKEEEQAKPLVLNAQGQPVATLVTDANNQLVTKQDTKTGETLPVVNTKNLPLPVAQVMSNARIENSTPFVNPVNVNSKNSFTEAIVLTLICSVFGGIGIALSTQITDK